MRLRPLIALGVALAACGSSTPCEQRGAGMLCELAGTGELAFDGDGKPATKTSLYLPSQIRRGPDGLLYVMDFNNQRIRRIEADGTMSTIAGDGFHAGATAGAPALESSLENPIDFDFLPDGRLVFVSLHDPRVIAIDADTTLEVLAGSTAGMSGSEGDGGPALAAQFLQLTGIAVGPDGAIYVSDALANRVRVIRNGLIDTFAGTGVPAYLGDGGQARAAALDGPGALALDPAGNVYISDSNNCAIRRVAAGGAISTVAGVGVYGFSGDGDPAPKSQLARPDGIAVAGDGTLYIGDRNNHRIRLVATDGTISTIVGTGSEGSAGVGGPALFAELGYPSRIVVDAETGSLLISDQTNSRVLELIR